MDIIYIYIYACALTEGIGSIAEGVKEPDKMKSWLLLEN